MPTATHGATPRATPPATLRATPPATPRATAETRQPRPRFEAIVDSLSVAVLVFRRQQLVYANAAAQHLRDRCVRGTARS